MRYKSSIDQKIVDRCKAHLVKYEMSQTNLSKKISQMYAYKFLCQKYGQENVSVPHILKEDESNYDPEYSEDFEHTVYRISDGTTIELFTNIQPADIGNFDTEANFVMVDRVDLEDLNYVIVFMENSDVLGKK